MRTRLSFLAAWAMLSLSAHAEILFEGYYRIEKKGQHVGYLVQRLASDSKGQRIMSAYVRMKDEGGAPDAEVYDSIKTIALLGSAKPVLSVYESNRSGSKDIIRTEFSAGNIPKVTFITKAGKKSSVRRDTAQKASLLSSFVFFVTDFKKLETQKPYEYEAYIEDRGRTGVGTLVYAADKSVSGQKVYHVVDDFMGQMMESFVAETGESLGARSLNGETVTYWVAEREEAVGAFKFPTDELTTLFGDLPEGKKNPWAPKSVKALDAMNTFKKPASPRTLSSNVKKQPTLPRRKL